MTETPRPAEGPDREALGDLLAHHAFSRVNDDGWTVCLCGHVAEGDDDDGSHGRHQADAVLALLPTPPAPGDAKCPTPGCRGDARYAPPGRGHVAGCGWPAPMFAALAARDTDWEGPR
jgi:hypothetical protein